MLDGGTGQLIGEALVYAQTLRLRGRWLADWAQQNQGDWRRPWTVTPFVAACQA